MDVNIHPSRQRSPVLAAAFEAVGDVDPEQSDIRALEPNSRYHRSQSKSPTTQLDPITSGDMSDSPGPSNDPPDPVPQTAGTGAAPDSSRPVGSHSALDIYILHFFTEVEFPTAATDKEKLQRVCKLCMDVHGTDKANTGNVPNYFYAKATGNSNLRRHLVKQHPREYNDVISEVMGDAAAAAMIWEDPEGQL